MVAKATRMKNPGQTVSQGTLIPAVLETAINTDVPGYVRAVVSSDVRSFDGSRVLVPRSSRLIGQYKSGVAGGQNRAYVIWTRLIRPDGVSVALASPAVDAIGQTGLAGKVDSHFLKRFGSALLLSVVGRASTVASGGAGLILSGGESAASVAASQQTARSRRPSGSARASRSASSPRRTSTSRRSPDERDPLRPPVASDVSHLSVYLDAYLAPFQHWLRTRTSPKSSSTAPGEVWIEAPAPPACSASTLPAIDDDLLSGWPSRSRGSATRASTASTRCCRRPCPTARASSSSARPRRGGTGLWRSAGTGCSTCRSTPTSAGRRPTAPKSVADASRARATSPSCARRSRRRDDPDLGRHLERQDHFPQRHAARDPGGRARGAGRGHAGAPAGGANGVGLIAVKGETGRGQGHCGRPAAGGAAPAPRPHRAGRAARQRGGELPARDQHRPPGLVSRPSTPIRPRGALEQIALMAMQTGIGLTRCDTIDYAASVIDIVVQLDRAAASAGSPRSSARPTSSSARIFSLRQPGWMPREDSNLDRRSQSP